MPVPDYQTFMRPLLTVAADGAEHSVREVIDRLAAQFHLTEEDKSERLPSGSETVLSSRIRWAKAYLDQAGAVAKTKRGHFRITDRGKELLNDYQDRVDVQILRHYPEFLKFQQRQTTSRSKHEASNTIANGPAVTATPEEIIQASVEEITDVLRDNLLSRIQELPPSFFERLVVDLIVAMGYGGSREYVVQNVGHSGDGGIDGIVNEDALGLDRVYIQAKRYADGNTIGRELIQQFAGALVGHNVTKGVFFTTSSYSKTAVEYAAKVPQRIILIDGNALTDLLIRYNVGVRVDRTIELKRIDLDYFDEAIA
jgi:restriction system protein